MHITITDKQLGGSDHNDVILDIATETLSLSDLIRLKVKKTVEVQNDLILSGAGRQKHIHAIQERLNKKPNHMKLLDVETEVKKAYKAFEDNGFFVMVDGRQLETLAETIIITDETEVGFLRLIPLAGG